MNQLQGMPLRRLSPSETKRLMYLGLTTFLIAFALIFPLFVLAAQPSDSGPVSAGGRNTCAIANGGAAECWGSNAYGANGNGLTSGVSTVPTLVSGLSSGVKAIATGYSYACAITSSNGVKCWGRNDYGQLGDGSTTNRSMPVDVSGLSSGVSAIGVYELHSCALLSNKTVKCWGHNGSGQLGDGTTTDRLTPVAVKSTKNAVGLSVGYSHTCIVTSDGKVKCWGYNFYGQLGDGSTSRRTKPVTVSGIKGASAVSAGQFHTCALLKSGSVTCWGNNAAGALGNGSTTNSKKPVQVSGLSSGVDAITVGYEYSCALLNNGGAMCWGYNSRGQLGDGTNTSRSVPVPVLQLQNSITNLSAADFHTCARLSDGRASCWGDNQYGQGGHGVSGSADAFPVIVSGFPNVSVVTTPVPPTYTPIPSSTPVPTTGGTRATYTPIPSVTPMPTKTPRP